jgi:hypothetical protein
MIRRQIKLAVTPMTGFGRRNASLIPDLPGITIKKAGFFS